ncbi:hypothetical protein CEXT_462451 [Caerostris extrusa]|uniref:Uncharacterized protein n=1 Tax=Caerostris extrusa TaxID=172846 RepID=A0AAV4WMA0_CAEEX|nr:hypothetical protein CEXT_462451 [Caerostris extrusa]
MEKEAATEHKSSSGFLLGTGILLPLTLQNRRAGKSENLITRILKYSGTGPALIYIPHYCRKWKSDSLGISNDSSLIVPFAETGNSGKVFGVVINSAGEERAVEKGGHVIQCRYFDAKSLAIDG